MNFEEDLVKRMEAAMESLRKRFEEQATQSLQELLAQQQAHLADMYGVRPDPKQPAGTT